MDIQEPVPPPVPAEDAFASFSFTTDAMYIRNSDTLQLSLNAVAMDGSPIPLDLRAVRWKSEDSAKVYVDTLGRVVGRNTTQTPVFVQAQYSHGFTTRTATIEVRVTDEEFSATSVQMVALDSTRVGPNAGANTPRVRLDLYNGATQVQGGVPLPVRVPGALSTSYSPTGGPEQEPVYLIQNNGLYTGPFWVKTSVNLYGTEVRDSLEFIGVYPYRLATFTILENQSGIRTSIDNLEYKPKAQPCAVVVFLFNNIKRPLEVVFSDSLASNGGCDSLPTNVSQQFRPFFKEQYLGGNLGNIPPGTGIYIRRSATRGEVSWYVRDAVTKERLSATGYIDVVHVE